MSNVIDFGLASCIEDKIYDGWCIFCSHVFPIKVPIFKWMCWELYMSIAKSCTSIVSKPDIVTCSSCNKGRSKLRKMKSPTHHITFKPMHEQGNWLFSCSFFTFTDFSRNSPYTQNISIRCCNVMLFTLKSIFLGKVVHCFETIWTSPSMFKRLRNFCTLYQQRDKEC